MKYLLIFALISLVLSQNTGTVECPKPCYATNTNPCPSSDLFCKENPSANPDAVHHCPRVCLKGNTAAADVEASFNSCSIPCDISTYQCSSDQYCKPKNGCYNCEPKCTPVQCTIAPCSADTRRKECAHKISANAVCVDNYCGGCLAEWYVNGVRVCLQVPDTCPACPNPCATGTKPVIDHYTGCDKCGVCEPVCQPVPCDNVCPYGRKRGNDGCETCECNPCPDLAASNCNLQCPNGYIIDPNTGCKKCACANATGCQPITCDLNCPYGYKYDSNNCKICACKECPQLNCVAVHCPNGYKYNNGCPTCDCLPYCQNFCPDGYEYTDSTGTPSNTNCQCRCKQLTCLADCVTGYVIDQYGCKTCECLPKYEICPKIACNLYCEHGYVVDVNNCPTCKCIEKPPVCPTLVCNVDCVYGKSSDAVGCPSCNCEPCPQVLCARYCPYGYKKGENGCPTCTCNDAPTCPTAGTVNAVAECPLNCEKGLLTDSGCTYCKCNPVDPCQCGVKPPEDTKPCPDGVSFQKFTDICARTDDNKCYYIQTKCPIGISVTLNKQLTEDEFKAIVAKIGATNTADVTFTKTANSDGTYTYTVWVKKEGLPESKSADQVNNDVSTKAKESDPNAVSYVLSDGTPQTGFANIVAPILGLLSLVLFF